MFVKHQKIMALPVILLMMVYLFTGCGDGGNKPVAKIGDRVITVSEFKENYSRGKSTETIKKAMLTDKKDHLDKMIDKELQIVAGYQQNIDENENVQQKVENRLESTILRRLVDIAIIEPKIPESEIKKYYTLSKKKANIQELSIKMGPRATDQEKRIVNDRLAAVRSELSGNVPFIDVMNKYSHNQKPIDPQTAANTVLRISPSTEEDPLVKAAFAMDAGEVSDTIRTKSGYSIIKLISIDTDEAKPYSVEKRRIRQELLRLRGKEIEKSYFEYLDLQEYPVTRTPQLKNKEDVFTNIDTRVLPKKLLVLEAEKKNLRNDPEVVAQQKELTESFMLSEIRKTSIDDRIVITEDSLLDYYERHKEEYKEPPTREVREIVVKDLDLANRLYQRAIAGENFTTLARKYNEKQLTKDKDGYLGFIPKTRHKIGEPVFNVPINGITKPIAIGSTYSILKVLSEKESQLKTFEESKPFLRVKVGREQKETLEKKWLDELRRNIKVVVYDNRLDEIFAEFKEE